MIARFFCKKKNLKYFFFNLTLSLATIYTFYPRENITINLIKIQNESGSYLNTRLNHEWIVNNNIMQYSSYIIFQDNYKVVIESLVIAIQQQSHQQFKCVLKYTNDTIKVYDTKAQFPIVQQIKHPNGRIMIEAYRSKCEFVTSDPIDRQSLVAIVDSKDFYFDRTESDFQNKKLSFSHLKYQLPTFINATMPKMKAVAHCIHMVYDLEFNKHKDSLSQFFDIITDLKVDQARIYIYRHHSLVDLRLKEKYKFLSIVYHEAVHHRVCQLEIYNLNRRPDSDISKYSHDQCMLGFKKYFQVIEMPQVKALHDKLNMNDCYLNFRYSYEIVTNYDFDEFIWPHRSTFGEIDTHYSAIGDDLKSICKHEQPLGLDAYEHESVLLSKHRNSGSLALAHVLMLSFTDDLDLFFRNLELALVDDKIKEKVVNFSGDGTKFSVSASQWAYASHLIKYYKIVRKMYAYLNRTNVSWNFNRAVAFHAPFRLGKSIFDTNRVEKINAHYSDMPRSTSLSHKFAFVAHFREYYDGFIKNSVKSITTLHIDIEYYHYLFMKYASSGFCGYTNNKNMLKVKKT
jgi:hypothetical protein